MKAMFQKLNQKMKSVEEEQAGTAKSSMEKKTKIDDKAGKKWKGHSSNHINRSTLSFNNAQQTLEPISCLKN